MISSFIRFAMSPNKWNADRHNHFIGRKCTTIMTDESTQRCSISDSRMLVSHTKRCLPIKIGSVKELKNRLARRKIQRRKSHGLVLSQLTTLIVRNNKHHHILLNRKGGFIPNPGPILQIRTMISCSIDRGGTLGSGIHEQSPKTFRLTASTTVQVTGMIQAC